MHQTKIIKQWQSSILALFLMTVLSVTTVYEFAGADELRGEGYIRGLSLSDFDGVGHIDSIDKDRIVIDDRSRKLPSGTGYYKPGPVKISASAFSVGSRVGYVEDRNGRITSLWLLPGKTKGK